MKYHGRTYTEIKNGSDVATVALFGTAGLAREILGDNPISGLPTQQRAAHLAA